MEQLGCYYLHTFFPSHLYLNQKLPFDFELDNIQYSVMVIRPLKSLIVNDFNNRIITTTNEKGLKFHDPEVKEISVGEKSLATVLENNHVAYIIDYGKNLYRELYTKDHTEVVVFFETIKDPKNIDFGLKALNHFINCYRIVSGDVLTLNLDKITYMGRVLKEYFHTYSPEELTQPKEERNKKTRGMTLGLKQVLFPFWNTQGQKIGIDETAAAKNLTEFFQKKTPISLLSEFMLKAREELEVHKNYKYSFIETWTALEIAIVSLLKKRKLEKGIFKNKIDNFESEVGISYLLNIELPLTQSLNDDNFKTLVAKVDGIRKMRNKVIHENKNISLEEARDAYNSAIGFLNYMGILNVRTTVV